MAIERDIPRTPESKRGRSGQQAGGKRTASDARAFLAAWCRDPIGIGSITPSGNALARLITSRIGANDGPVIELGPGTGVFTQALIERGVRERELLLVETETRLAERLRQRFPAACVLNLDAAALTAIPALRGNLATAAVSGLPILWMPRADAEQILRGVFAHMRPEAALYQFTYQLRCPIPVSLLRELGLEAQRIGWALANLPPASVYRITRRAAVH